MVVRRAVFVAVAQIGGAPERRTGLEGRGRFDHLDRRAPGALGAFQVRLAREPERAGLHTLEVDGVAREARLALVLFLAGPGIVLVLERALVTGTALLGAVAAAAIEV